MMIEKADDVAEIEDDRFHSVPIGVYVWRSRRTCRIITHLRLATQLQPAAQMPLIRFFGA